MPDIQYLKSRKEGKQTVLVGWIPFDVFEEGDLKIKVPSESDILDLMEEFRIKEWINVSEAAGDEQKPKLRGRNQQRMMVQPSYQKDTEMKLGPFALECVHRYVIGWRDFFTTVPVPREKWETLQEKYRSPKQATRETTKFFERIEEPFDKDIAIELVKERWIIGFATLMMSQAQLQKALQEQEYELEEKNSSLMSQPA